MSRENRNTQSSKRIVLMSIREEYYNEILSGKKHFEYRKKYCEEESIAYIYISKTKKMIVGKIWFGRPIIDSAENIASLAENDQPGVYQNIKDYIGKNNGYAIPVQKIELINEISLKDIKEKINNFCPPQSYYYLDNKQLLLDYIEEKEKKSE